MMKRVWICVVACLLAGWAGAGVLIKQVDLILKGIHGRLVVLRNGRYDNAPVDVVTSSKKLVDVKKHYNTDRLRPHFKSFEFQPLFIMSGT